MTSYSLRMSRRPRRRLSGYCQICNRAPAERRIHYNGMAGLIFACNKKMHDLSAKNRRRAKDAHSGKKRALAKLQKHSPLKSFDPPKIAAYIKNTYKKVKFALTRREQSR